MRRLHLLLLLAAAAVAVLPLLIYDPPEEPGPLSWLSHGGAVRGAWCSSQAGHRFRAFQGIPYAQPPQGELRFAAPEPAEPWQGERDASREGPICPQPSAHPFLLTCPSRMPTVALVRGWLLHLPRLLLALVRGALGQREDCLFLNVFVPEPSLDLESFETLDAQPNGSAVLVWLHGGAFLIGDGSAEEYGPDLFLEQGVIVVTLNYRLGVLGFLYGGPDSGAPGNMGLRDQALALRWVRDNALAFGGDPTRVTLWGESAGAVSAHLHTMAPGQGLFQRLILSSGVAALPWALQERPAAALRDLADALGWPRGRHPDHPADLVRFLKKVPVENIVAAGNEIKSITNFVGNGMQPLRWAPVVEDPPGDPGQGRFLSRDPLSILQEGTFKSVPTMLGVNSREGLLWLTGKNPRAVSRMLQRFDLNFSLAVRDLPFVWRRHHELHEHHEHHGPSADQVRRATHLIRGFFFGRQRISMRTLSAFLDLYSDIIFNIGVREATTLHLRWVSTPLYLYRFSFDGRLGFLKRLIGTSAPGVGHADELGYLFNVKVLPPISLPDDSPEILTQRRLVSLWVNFIKFGDPTPDNTNFARWKQTSLDNDVYLDIDSNVTLRAYMFEPRMKFWSDLYRNVLQHPLSW